MHDDLEQATPAARAAPVRLDTRERVIAAFTALLASRDFRDLTVGDVLRASGVPRTTFYRHFAGKVDVLGAMHARWLSGIYQVPDARTAWLSDVPPEPLVTLLTRKRPRAARHQSISYMLGSDFDVAFSVMRRVLVHAFLDSLSHAFAPEELQVGLPELASAVAGVYLAQIMVWADGRCVRSPAEVAADIQRFTAALVRSALRTA